VAERGEQAVVDNDTRKGRSCPSAMGKTNYSREIHEQWVLTGVREVSIRAEEGREGVVS